MVPGRDSGTLLSGGHAGFVALLGFTIAIAEFMAPLGFG